MILSRILVRAVISLLAITTLGVSVAADTTVQTAALIDLDQTAVGGLVESQLLEKSRLTWVERADFDKITGELSLENLYGAAADQERIKLGQLIKADIIVLLRRSVAISPTAKTSYQIVIFETRLGLRLATDRIQATESIETDAATLTALANAGIDKGRRPIQKIFAVPPFVCQDLMFRFEHLKSAYAKLVEQALLQYDGVVVVELEEARHISREMMIGDPGSQLRRPIPQFILGEYRHGGDVDLQLTLRFELTAGAESLARKTYSDLKPDSAPDAIRAVVSEFIGDSNELATPPIAPAMEANQLVKRARLLSSLGNWQETLDLVEVALLIDPNHEEARMLAVLCSGILAGNLRQYMRPGREKQAEAALRAYQRGLEHYESLLVRHSDLKKLTGIERRIGIPRFPFSALVRATNGKATQTSPLYLETIRKQRSMLLGLVRLRSKQGKSGYSSYLYSATIGQPDEEFFGTIGDIVLELQDLPGAEERSRKLMWGWYSVYRLQKPRGKEMLERLAIEGNEEVQLVVAGLKQRLQKYEDHASRIKKPKKVVDRLPTGDGTITPLALTWKAVNGEQGTLNWVDGCKPISNRWDVLWSGNQLMVMKEPGKLREVKRLPGLNFRFNQVCFDGKYIWAGTRRPNEPPSLVICDPVSEEVWDIPGGKELPFPTDDRVDPRVHRSKMLAVAAIAPGEACLVGSFGRTWIGHARFDPHSGLDVDIFHESREVSGHGMDDPWLNTRLSFSTRQLITFTARDPRETRILIGRGQGLSVNDGFALWVAPYSRTVQADNRRIEALRSWNKYDQQAGHIYFVDRPWRLGFQLMRLGTQGTKMEKVRGMMPQGLLYIDGDRVHVFGTRWWTGPITKGKMTVTADVPWNFRGKLYNWSGTNSDARDRDESRIGMLQDVWHSNHYGILVGIRPSGGKRDQPGLYHAIYSRTETLANGNK